MSIRSSSNIATGFYRVVKGKIVVCGDPSKANIKAAILAEREACAKVAEKNSFGPYCKASQYIAQKIRARCK